MDGLNKMTFKAFREHDGKLSPISDREPFTVMLNPNDLSISSAIHYISKEKGNFTNFNQYEATAISIPKLLFDTTGAIPKTEWPKGCSTIKQMIDKLKKVVYDFHDDSHQPPVVKVFWGDNTYTVRIHKFDIRYTLFNMKGAPVRAEVTLGTKTFYQESSKNSSKKKSPDLTHLVEVKAGDTLPLMCERVYNDPSYYLQVAKINGLTNFRQLKPGTMLEFPPIRD